MKRGDLYQNAAGWWYIILDFDKTNNYVDFLWQSRLTHKWEKSTLTYIAINTYFTFICHSND